jgi:hypothetical protein
MRSLPTLVPLKPVRCPSCRLLIDGAYVWAHRRCVVCGSTFRIRWFYVWTLGLLAYVISLGLAYAVGKRGHGLAALTGLAALPVFWGMVVISLRLFPPDIDVLVPGWSAGDSDADRELEAELDALRELDVVVGWEEPAVLAVAPDDAPGTSSGRLPLSMPKDTPVTFEGIAIAIALAGLLAYNVYLAVFG